MILSNVNIGTGPSSGDGDPLRSAFATINTNFQTITNNVNALTNSVNTVAGRTGNVILTTQDIVGINYYATNSAVSSANLAMRGYVDSKITANIASLVDLAPSTLDTLRELADAIGDDPNFAVNVALSVSNANTKMRSYVDGQILAANAGVTSANLGMKGYVDSQIGGTYSNINVQSYLTTNSYANQSYVNLANVNMKAYVDGQIAASNTSANTSQLWNTGYTMSVASSNGNVTLPRGATLGANGTTAEFKPAAGGVLQLRSDNNYNRVQVNDTDVSIYGGDSHWTFDLNGKLTLPSGANITAYVDGITTIRDGEGVEIDLNVNNGFSTTLANGTRVLANAHVWTFGLDGNLTVPGSIIPSANVSYSLGNITHQWKDLWVSNNTIYIGGAALTVANGNLLINGNGVSGGDTYGNIQVATYLPTYTGDITAKNITSADDITITNASGGSNVADIYIESADDIFVQAKNRTIPGPIEGGDLNLYAGSGGADDVTVGSGGGGDIQLYAGHGGAGNVNVGSFGGTISIVAGDGGAGSATSRAGGGGGISITAGSAGSNNGGAGYAGGGVFITAGDSSDPTFDRGSIVLTSGDGGDETTVGGYVQINIPQVGTNPGGQWVFTGVGTVFEPPPNAEIFNPSVGNLTLGTVGSTIIRNIGGVTTYDWVFDNTGNLTLPAGGQILDSTGNIYASGSSYGNVEVATYLPTHTGNVQAGNVKVTSAYRFASGAVTITNGDSHVELSPDTGTNALAGVKVGGNGYILGPNASRNITLNYGSASGVVGMQSNVVIGTGGSGNLWVYGNVIARDVTASNISASGTSGRIGYINGGFVQQTTSNANGVSLNTISGNIQLMGINLGVNSLHTVAFSNNKLEENDMILITHHSGGVTNFAVGAYYFSAGTALIWIRNITGADTATVTPMLKFAIIKAPGA